MGHNGKSLCSKRHSGMGGIPLLSGKNPLSSFYKLPLDNKAFTFKILNIDSIYDYMIYSFVKIQFIEELIWILRQYSIKKKYSKWFFHTIWKRGNRWWPSWMVSELLPNSTRTKSAPAAIHCCYHSVFSTFWDSWLSLSL